MSGPMTPDRRYESAEWPHGCRCACCKDWFEEGDRIIDREVAWKNWSTPTCETCALRDAPLCADHPFAQDRTPIMCADGFVR